MRGPRAVALSVTALMFLLGGLLFLTSGAAVVVTRGVSMEPTIRAGALVVTWPAEAYRVGDVVAYNSELLDTTVLHRLVDRAGGRWLLQGDGNSWLDPEHPTDGQLLGRQILHVPHAGAALAWAAQTRLWLVIALVGLIAGGTTRHVRKVGPVAQHRKSSTGGLSRSSLIWAIATVTAGAAALTGVHLLTARPVTAGGTAAAVGGVASGPPSLTFGYSAALRASAASGDGTAVAPEPVFRALADDVTVRIGYSGPAEPGSIAVLAQLATTSGWHDEVPLLMPVRFAAGSWEGTVRLDLPELAGRAQAASAAIGAPVGEVRVALTPEVAAGGRTFTRTLELVLDATALRLKNPEAPLVLSDAGPAGAAPPAAAGARAVALAALWPYGGPAALVAGALVWAAWSRQRRALTPLERSRRRHATLLLPSQPVGMSPGVAMVDVHDLDRLAALASGWHLPVLHWIDGTAEVFLVIADQTAYRYRATTPEAPAAMAAPSWLPAAPRR
ncbi:MAG: hypothetical protein JWN08_3372 [Frankiales bacterium]|nr:hypothetical protein [Frankiales bacterium]